jgi:hypothetical protein
LSTPIMAREQGRFTMSHTFEHLPADVCLMLRAHAEQHWLTGEVTSVLAQLQHRERLPDEQLGAALAYLEVTWIEARRLAAETEAACAELDAAPPGSAETLPSRARSYHATVCALREAMAPSVDRLLAAPRPDPEADPEDGAEADLADRIGCAVHGRGTRIRFASALDPLRRDSARE